MTATSKRIIWENAKIFSLYVSFSTIFTFLFNKFWQPSDWHFGFYFYFPAKSSVPGQWTNQYQYTNERIKKRVSSI